MGNGDGGFEDLIQDRDDLFYTTTASFSVRMAERSKALRLGRSPIERAWVRIPLLTILYVLPFPMLKECVFPIYDLFTNLLCADCY